MTRNVGTQKSVDITLRSHSITSRATLNCGSEAWTSDQGKAQKFSFFF